MPPGSASEGGGLSIDQITRKTRNTTKSSAASTAPTRCGSNRRLTITAQPIVKAAASAIGIN